MATTTDRLGGGHKRGGPGKNGSTHSHSQTWHEQPQSIPWITMFVEETVCLVPACMHTWMISGATP